MRNRYVRFRDFPRGCEPKEKEISPGEAFVKLGIVLIALGEVLIALHNNNKR